MTDLNAESVDVDARTAGSVAAVTVSQRMSGALWLPVKKLNVFPCWHGRDASSCEVRVEGGPTIRRLGRCDEIVAVDGAGLPWETPMRVVYAYVERLAVGEDGFVELRVPLWTTGTGTVRSRVAVRIGAGADFDSVRCSAAARLEIEEGEAVVRFETPARQPAADFVIRWRTSESPAGRPVDRGWICMTPDPSPYFGDDE
jgi:hypothetical protein